MIRYVLPRCYSMSVLTKGVAFQELGSMYDYLAKVILLGPSGSGKFVHILSSSANPRAYLAPGPASYTESLRMNVSKPLLVCVFVYAEKSKGECYQAKRSALNFPPKSSKLVLALGENGSSCSYGIQQGPKDSGRYRDPTIVVQPERF